MRKRRRKKKRGKACDSFPVDIGNHVNACYFPAALREPMRPPAFPVDINLLFGTAVQQVNCNQCIRFSPWGISNTVPALNGPWARPLSPLSDSSFSSLLSDKAFGWFSKGRRGRLPSTLSYTTFLLSDKHHRWLIIVTGEAGISVPHIHVIEMGHQPYKTSGHDNSLVAIRTGLEAAPFHPFHHFLVSNLF
jgi:hypothetical protein